MTTVGFICLLRDAGACLAQMAHDIAAVARPGDQVFLIAAGSTDDTAAQIARYAVTPGWPDGVAVHDTPTPYDACDHVVVVSGTGGLNRAAFITARHMAEAQNSDVLASTAHISTLFGLILRPGHLGPTLDPDDPVVLAQLRPQAIAPLPFSRHPSPGLTPTSVAQLGALLQHQPQTALWIAAQIAATLPDTAPGARMVIRPMLADLAHIPIPDRPAPPAPMLHRAAPIQLNVQGQHAHRSPFAYPALDPLWDREIAHCATPAKADLILYAHPRDLAAMPAEVARSTAPLVLLSEEPFWDSLFSPDVTASRITLPAARRGLARLHQLNHHTSAIFDFDKIPYYLLTDPRIISAYQALFQRNAAKTAADWAQSFAARQVDCVFMAERRPEPFHDMHVTGADLTGLCAWRTRLAIAATGIIERRGASWQGGKTRFQLTDWHADKLAQMDGHTRILSALENTHQPIYLSEKLFDAFACGTRPLYYASPTHRVHDLGLPPGAWVNLAGLASAQAAQTAAALTWDDPFFADYAAAQAQLAALFGDPAIVAAERHRLKQAVTSDIYRLIDLGPA